jgi:uncharacterized protein YnzC (UPF0291/DUF896 family)
VKQEKIDRINELARKAKSEGLTAEETEERRLLREEYLEAVRTNFRQTLESIKFVDKDER